MEHNENCMRRQFWDAGEEQCPCDCRRMTPDGREGFIDHWSSKALSALFCKLADESGIKGEE